jgi:hypothetical protein
MPKATQPPPQQACLEEAALRQLLTAGAVSSVVARGSSRGFGIEAQLGNGLAVLVNARGQRRSFASLSTVATLLRRLGCSHFAVDTDAYKPGRIRPAQPARSTAMKAGRLPRAAGKSIKPKSRTA